MSELSSKTSEEMFNSVNFDCTEHSRIRRFSPLRIETERDFPVEELEESFGEAFAIAAKNAEFREDEEQAALIETGRALPAKYMAEAAPWIAPQAVELPVEGVIVGVRVQGIVDLLDTEVRIIDCTTAARRPGSRQSTACS